MEYISSMNLRSVNLSSMKVIKTIALIFALVSASQMVIAAPSSLVVWDSETRNIVTAGDAVRGKALSKSCSSCHGDTGISPSPNWPNLSGQIATYTYKQLQDYKMDKRKNGIMQAMVRSLTDAQMADVAAFYASQPLPEVTVGWFDTPDVIRKGDGKRLLPGCDLCHGRGGIGAVVDVPALAGQTPQYFIKTMKEFKSGARGNDIYNRMRIIAESLSDAEIQMIAQHYATTAP